MKTTRPSHPTRSGPPDRRRLLCATDFTPGARQAADAAVALAARMRAKIELIHVSPPAAFRAVPEGLREESIRLREAGAAVKATHGVGAADEQLVRHARARSHSLIVLGSSGNRQPLRWLLGGVGERTAQHAGVPTLIVRDAEPFLAWNRGDRPLRILVAFDFSSTSDAALEAAASLFRWGPCAIIIGHAARPPADRASLTARPKTGPPASARNTRSVLERSLQQRVATILQPQDFEVRVDLNPGRPEARLVAIAIGEQVDVIFSGTHQYRGFERIWHQSVSRGLLHRAPMNVWVAPRRLSQARVMPVAHTIRRILVMTDFTDTANQAIPHAYSLLPGPGFVHLLHVIHPREMPGGRYEQGFRTPRLQTEHEAHARDCSERLRRLTARGSAARGILTTVEVAEGRDLAAAACQAAERFGAQLICLASRGQSPLSKSLLGSVGQQVLARSRCPVLVVPPVKG